MVSGCGSLVVLVVLCAASVCCGLRPPYVGCQSSQECGKGACCVIGMGRYSIPRCLPRRELGDDCRPHSEPVNTTLHYPDGVALELAGVYYIHCPCMAGLTCDYGASDTAKCLDNEPSNNLDDYVVWDDREY